MADQCIACLEPLDVDSEAAPPAIVPATASSTADLVLSQQLPGATAAEGVDLAVLEDGLEVHVIPVVHEENHENVALIEACGHILHESCLRRWIATANSCPICRQTFNTVHVYDKVGGTRLSAFTVEDKKQVAEFDAQAWLAENPEDVGDIPCPICNQADREEILLLCDNCDTPFHTDCIGLGLNVPDGTWYCFQCDPGQSSEHDLPATASSSGSRSAHGRLVRQQPRTQARVRRDRQRARQDHWQGAWGQLAGRVWDTLLIDLDYHNDDDPEIWEDYRRSQQLREHERAEQQRWQQRLRIASRLGARDVFREHMPEFLSRPAHSPPPVPQETPEERLAWGDLDKARDSGPPNSRKRKSRSATAEPEVQPEPERKLKRPRTRRLPTSNGLPASSSAVAGPSNSAVAARPSTAANATASASTVATAGPSAPTKATAPVTTNAAPPLSRPLEGAPSFLSSLLKEVEMSTPSDENNLRTLFGRIPGANDAGSPVGSSPPPSGLSSPRATSSTPPPFHARPSSPPLTLSSHIEPIYPRANYSPTRAVSQRGSPSNSRDNSDSERRQRRPGGARVPFSPGSPGSRRPTVRPRANADRDDGLDNGNRRLEPESPTGKTAPKRYSAGALSDSSDSEQRARRLSHNKKDAIVTSAALPRGNPATSSDSSDSDLRKDRVVPELQQPLPRRPRPTGSSQGTALSAGQLLPREMKESISSIVRGALQPHWTSKRLTKQQYETINRQVSRRLYDEVSDPTTVNDEARRTWEQIASKEVARAMTELEA